MQQTQKERSRSKWKIVGLSFSFILVVGVVVLSILTGYSVSWTGFGDFTTPTGEFIRGKTVWDWFELVIIPVFITLGVIIIGWWERQTEREIATDRQQEIALQTYLDRMTDLLLKEKLRTTKNKEVRNVARMRTLTVLRGLDKRRKGDVLLFINEAGLINAPDPIINLSGADITGAYLQGFDLSNAYLQSVNLSEAILHLANLRYADLTGANLQNTRLAGADLEDAILAFTFVGGASFKNATMPDGTKHE